MGAEMTDEDLSELAECLQDACDQAQREGWHIGRDAGKGPCCCPFGALIPVELRPAWAFPVISDSVPFAAAAGFTRGFDALECLYDRRAYDLGILFREQYK